MDCDDLIQKFEEEIEYSSEKDFKPAISRPRKKRKAKNNFGKIKEGLFMQDLHAERVLGATTRENKLVFLIKW